MAVTKEDIHQLVDRLKEDQLDEVYEHVKDLLEGEQVDFTDSEIDGLVDQDEYYKDEERASDVQKQQDLSVREKL
ncbi:hypothetical protein [Geomicrobium sp. JCM 19039]|uniref:hypothetical protein n=1 Tax=Geomicrobium sp. JCM 19039 TaxID=1460636 RepID=UPI00045F1F8C|nr:hypothetical protein [Geomicrobium sp. JCM 19039]GAK13437.1 hypothetical protein JCM19039_3283 [Geomicrobium sp. JCM 19039]